MPRRPVQDKTSLERSAPHAREIGRRSLTLWAAAARGPTDLSRSGGAMTVPKAVLGPEALFLPRAGR
jgi:hypothetical protein